MRRKIEVEVVEEVDQSLEGVWVVVGQVGLGGACFLIFRVNTLLAGRSQTMSQALP